LKLLLASRMVLIRVIYSGHPIVVAFLLSFYHEFFFFVISMFFFRSWTFLHSHVQQYKCKLTYVYIYRYLSIYARIYNVNIQYFLPKNMKYFFFHFFFYNSIYIVNSLIR
jgi:hypothetical protein